jgi:hypothetical protein
VVQQLAQLFDRVAHVGAQHVLAIELVVHLTDRALRIYIFQTWMERGFDD